MEKRAGVSGGSVQGLHEHFTSCTICPETHLAARSTSHARLGMPVHLSTWGAGEEVKGGGPASPTPTPRGSRPWTARVRPAATQPPERRQELGQWESLAGKGAEKAKERRSTRKIYWADQMHRGG